MQTPQFGGRTDAAGAWNCSSCSIQTASTCVACGPSSVVGEDIESQVGEGDGGRATGAQLATNDRMVEGAEPMPSWMVPPSVGDNTLLSSKTAPLPVGPPSPQICVDPVHARQNQRGSGPGGRNPSRKNRAAAALSTANIMATFEREICDDCCIQNFKVQSDAPFTAVQCARAERVNGNRGEEQQWLWLTLSSMWNGADFSWTFGGHATCFHCWSALMGYGRNNTKVCSARAAITREFKQSGTLLTTPRQGATLGRPPIAGGKQAMAKQWFHKYVERNGDFDPTRNRVFISKRPLTAMFDVYRTDCNLPAHEMLKTAGTFGRVIKQELGKPWCGKFKGQDVECAIYEQCASHSHARGFKKCGTCTDLDAEIRAAKTPAEREAKRREKDRHLEQQYAARAVYAATKSAMRTTYGKADLIPQPKPWMVLSLIIDGADQAKHHLPWFNRWPGNLDSKNVLKQKLTGVYVHGLGRLFLYKTLPWLKTGGNLTSHCIWRVLCALADDRQPCPNEIRLQVDGASDNWCHTNLCFASHLLLADNDIAIVRLSRLEGGHTHTDIDQLFAVCGCIYWSSLSRVGAGRFGGSLFATIFWPFGR